jgi:hypothetical protein
MTIRRVGNVAGFAAALLALFLFAVGFYCAIRGEPIPPLRILGFLVAVILIIVASLLEKATEGADHLAIARSPAGATIPSPALSGLEVEKNTVAVVLTPSEVVYLAGDRFVTPGGAFSGYRLAGSGISVSKRALAEQVYAAAFLAAEKAGAFHLAVRPKKTLQGLRTVQALYADSTGRTSPYPFNSLESRLLSLSSGPNEVQRILHDLIPKSADPFARANHLVGSYLADRGLLQVSRTKNLLVFTNTEVHLPERTAALFAGRVGEVQSLFSESQEARPELWKKLIDDISKGISSRQDQDDNFDPSW